MKMEDDESRASTMKKARSVDAPYDMRSLNDHNYNQNSLPRAKSDFNLTGSSRYSFSTTLTNKYIIMT